MPNNPAIVAPERVTVDSMLLADAVQVRDGLLFLMGGGWMRCWPPAPGQFPIDRPLPLAVVFRVPYHETNIEHNFSISVRDSDEQDLVPPAQGQFRVGRDVSLTEGMSQLVPVAGGPTVKLERPGIYYIVLSLDGQEAHRISFEVLNQQPR